MRELVRNDPEAQLCLSPHMEFLLSSFVGLGMGPQEWLYEAGEEWGEKQWSSLSRAHINNSSISGGGSNERERGGYIIEVLSPMLEVAVRQSGSRSGGGDDACGGGGDGVGSRGDGDCLGTTRTTADAITATRPPAPPPPLPRPSYDDSVVAGARFAKPYVFRVSAA